MKKRTFVWVVDPLETLDLPNDTTLRLAQAALALGHRSVLLEPSGIALGSGSKPELIGRELLELPQPPRSLADLRLAKPAAIAVNASVQFHYRLDPPVDAHYLHPLQLLKLALKSPDQLVNPFEALSALSEKWIALLAAKKIAPPTLISADGGRLTTFARGHGTVILKPLHEAQSKGILRLEAIAPDLLETLHSRTDKGTTPVLLQKFQPAIETDGETRMWFLDGEFLGAFRKFPLAGDYKVDMDRGSRVRAHPKLTAAEKRLMSPMRSLLKKHRIRLAALDAIDGWVTDLNFTSPGLLLPLERFLDQDLAARIIRRLASVPRLG